MFGSRYFGARYFGARYFGHRGFGVLDSVQGNHFGARYFGPRYWGGTYFGAKDSAPLTLTVTSGLAIGATTTVGGGSIELDSQFESTNALQVSASLQMTSDFVYPDTNDWSFTPPLDVTPMVGSVTFSGNLSYEVTPAGVGRYFGGRYFGTDYFGTRYWATSNEGMWLLEPTAGLTVAATSNIAADITLALELPGATLSPAATVTFAGDINLGGEAALTQTADLPTTATVTLLGDLVFDVVEPLGVVAVAPVAATVTLSGDIVYTAEMLLVVTSGPQVLGEGAYALPYGDFVYSAPPPPPTPYPEDGAPIPTRPRWRRVYAQGWLDLFVNQEPPDTPGGTPPVQ